MKKGHIDLINVVDQLHVCLSKNVNLKLLSSQSNKLTFIVYRRFAVCLLPVCTQAEGYVIIKDIVLLVGLTMVFLRPAVDYAGLCMDYGMDYRNT